MTVLTLHILMRVCVLAGKLSLFFSSFSPSFLGSWLGGILGSHQALFFYYFLGMVVTSVPSRTKIQNFARVLSHAASLRDSKKRKRRKERTGPLEWSRKYARIRTAEGIVYGFAEVERKYQTELLSDTSKRIIVGKSRQLGISNTCAFIAAEEAIAGGTVLVVSKNLEQAAQFLSYVYVALSDAPHPRFLKQNKYSLEFVGGGSIICQPATKKAGRGIAATLVILDESAWQLYAREIFTAILPTLSTTRGRLIVLSTPNGTGNLFQEQWDYAMAEAGNKEDPALRTWSLHYLPWWVNPAWDEDWATQTREDMGEKEFAQEHEVDFAGSGLNVFSRDQIDNAFKYGILEVPPLAGHRYINAFDIGRTRDGFAGFSIDITTNPFTVVHIEHHYKKDYPDQAKIIDWVDENYVGETWVESNGPGDPVIGFLTRKVTPFFTTAIMKKNMIDSLVLLLDKKELRIPEHKALKLQLTRYLRRDQGIEQDLVMALAIAAFEAGRPVREMLVEAGGDRGGMTMGQVIEALAKMTGPTANAIKADDRIPQENIRTLAEDIVADFHKGHGR